MDLLLAVPWGKQKSRIGFIDPGRSSARQEPASQAFSFLASAGSRLARHMGLLHYARNNGFALCEERPRCTASMTEVSLDTLVPGEKGVVGHLKTSSFEVRQRLLEMGLTKGVSIQIIRLAPLGDPIEIALRGYRLSLRRKEAEAVMIHKSKT